MTVDTSFERHMYEADIKPKHKEHAYQRRDCVADGACERPAVSRGMCRRHAVKARR